MKKIAVIGLGIIGASLCRAFIKSGYEAAGFDKDEATLAFALSSGYITEKAENLSDYECVFLAVPPLSAIKILDEAEFQDNAFVADICGVKESIEKAVYEKPRNYRYIGLHPMAGKETSGIFSSSATLFQGANLIVTIARQTDERTILEAKEYARALGFGNIVECSAVEHDRKIALTSQLAHIVSNAYVKSVQVKGCDGFTGGSFQDMTRIAGVDEKIWTPLYMLNRKNILNELNCLIENLSVYREALNDEDAEKLSEALLEGRLIRQKIKRKND
ncbi:MAG: prephenate dehydrogenase [Clostridia bacterium]|nr:prephenate dehydrogenase [Clostridia bacterium]